MTGEARPEQQEALQRISAIEPAAVNSDLRAALAEAFAYAAMRGGTELEGVRQTLERLLAPLYLTNELAAALSGIPSLPGPTGEETTAALLVARLPASEVSDSLRAAMNHAVTVISGDMYSYSLPDRVLVGALAELFTDEELARVIGSIETVPLTPAQVGAIRVAFRHWGYPTEDRVRDLPGQEVRAAMMRAAGRLNEIDNTEESEIQRLEAAGDRAGQEAIWRQRRERGWSGGTARSALALSQVLRAIGDPAALPVLAGARGHNRADLVPFGEAAVAPAVAAIRSPSAHRDQMRFLLADLARIASTPLAAENKRILSVVARGFLSGETLAEKGMSAGQGLIIDAAADLALALDEPSLAAMVDRLAADPEELVGIGVAPRSADESAWRLRKRIAWSPVVRSSEQLIATLRTIPSSPRPTLSQREAAEQLERMPAEEIDPELHAAMTDAWTYTRTPSVHWHWYHVRTPLTNALVARYSPADVARHMRALTRGESGPDQDLAIEAVVRWRDETPEEARVAMIEALERLNGEARETGRPAYRSRHYSLADAVNRLDDPRGVPALIRAGLGLTCGWTTPALFEVSVEEMTRAIIEDAAPGWLVSEGLRELGYISAGGGLRERPERIRALILDTAIRFLDGEQPTLSSSVSAEDRIAILEGALYLAVATADERLADRVNQLATDVAAVEALGLDRAEAADVSAYARELLAARPLLGPSDC
ncbi:hypothetical protein [Candidatus Palauibacter sp.]|uniref:hypothetical protein n=1 Tax=Candidatus Palauibacter sp. TaxID=3101350 RepID=UPI003B013482